MVTAPISLQTVLCLCFSFLTLIFVLSRTNGNAFICDCTCLYMAPWVHLQLTSESTVPIPKPQDLIVMADMVFQFSGLNTSKCFVRIMYFLLRVEIRQNGEICAENSCSFSNYQLRVWFLFVSRSVLITSVIHHTLIFIL